MKLSIIIPALNEAQNIRRFLQPLQALRAQGHEVILVDGYSSDGTAELARSFVDQLLYSERGRATQMNCGAKAASGDVLLFLHADTTLPDNAAQLITDALSTSHWGRFNVRLSGSSFTFRIIETFMNWRSCITGICTGDQAIFVSKAVFNQVGGYADIPLMEDIDISRTLKKHFRPSCIKSTVTTSSRRWEDNGIGRTVLFMSILRLKYFLGASADSLVKHYYPDRTTISSETNHPHESKPDNQTTLIVFTKAPIAGNVKTRLVPDIGADNACALHAILTHHTLQKFCGHSPSAIQLWVDPDNLQHPFIKGCMHDYPLTLHQQVGADLGERMSQACKTMLKTVSSIILIGTDCPALDNKIINKVKQKLIHHHAVIIPALDGGYVLLALSKHNETLFRDINWGTNQVLKQTLKKLEHLGWKYYLFNALRDLDNQTDLAYFKQSSISQHILKALHT